MGALPTQGQAGSFIGDARAGAPPLIVDLDGTLIQTDLLTESVMALLRKQPLFLFVLPFWILRGEARLKHEIARRVALDMSVLPWRGELLDYLRSERAAGRSLVLATGSDVRLARQVADYLGLFDSVIASDGARNVCGESKRDLLVRQFGEKGFDYAADGGWMGRRDLPVWASARKAILLNPNRRVRRQAERVSGVDRVFIDNKERVAERWRALRPRHWLKNLLVFVPVFAAHRFDDVALLERSLIAFVAFGCCASSGYLLNDLIDLETDRRHPTKRSRPFAAGLLPLTWALAMIPALLTGACVLAALISPALLGIVLAYFAMSAAYSLHIKKIVVLDVLFLAGLYTVRIMAGSAAAGLWLSHWLLAFSIFLFFSLALVKRYSELVVMRRVAGDAAKARGYELSDGELLAAMGTASGYLAVLVLALYISSDQAGILYGRRELLWFLCPLLLYWVSYVWLMAHRGQMQDDPVVFATGNRTSRILILLLFVAALLAL
jgi:4-hydroxybenzoate polyprenyltransferase/phosphoserine phosphatase